MGGEGQSRSAWLAKVSCAEGSVAPRAADSLVCMRSARGEQFSGVWLRLYRTGSTDKRSVKRAGAQGADESRGPQTSLGADALIGIWGRPLRCAQGRSAGRQKHYRKCRSVCEGPDERRHLAGVFGGVGPGRTISEFGWHVNYQDRGRAAESRA